MLNRRTLLAGGSAILLAGCANDRPPAVISTTGGGYSGTNVHGTWQLPDETLTDTSGKPYNMRTSPTTPVVILFFGYSNCPDVCTGILSDMAVAKRRLDDPSQIAKITLMCVTTDPARDTPQVLGEYLGRIDAEYVGLTGELDHILAIGNSLGVAIEEGKKLPSGGYEVDHGTQILGFKDGVSEVVWTTGTTIADLKADYAKLAG